MYHIAFWGDHQHQAALLLNSSQTEYWFHTPDERDRFRNYLITELGEDSLVFHEAEGVAALVRATATAALGYQGVTYVVINKLLYGDDAAVLEKMWKEGPLANHQNRADIIRKQCAPDFPQLPEGHTITLASLAVCYESVIFNKPHNAKTSPPKDGERILGYSTCDGFHEVWYRDGEYQHFEGTKADIHYWYHKPPVQHLQLPKEFRPAYNH